MAKDWGKKKKDEEKNQSQQKLGDIPAVKRVSSGTYVEKWTALSNMLTFKEVP